MPVPKCKVWCEKQEHQPMIKFVGEVVQQFSTSRLMYDLRHVHTCLTWGFRDRRIYGYRLKVDRENNQINIFKDSDRLAAVKLQQNAN